MTGPDLEGFITFFRSQAARPLVRELAWSAGAAIGLIILSALIAPAVAYAVYLGVAVFYASALTGIFVSLLERETGEHVVSSSRLRRWLAGCALVLAFLAAVILV